MVNSYARLAAAWLCLCAVAGMAVATADPVTLPPMTSSGGGPIVGAGSNSAVSQQLFGFASSNVQEVDGSDAAGFFTAAAAVANPQLAAPFSPLHRALGCQNNNAGFGARAYRRTDGQWGGGMLVISKSSAASIDTLTACEMTNWHRPSAGGQNLMCASGYVYPNDYNSRRSSEGYFVLIAGTDQDFCTAVNAKFKTNSSSWP
jgi:hypothetical protein